ncbi:type III pantothenate kinase [Thiomicrorhabdus sp. Milos-T2]|uniref:type III pantothenate kinase n=1 Tax=Thiomicrorhabdus sp. Milos-T2 TaxID=90814 RepID=UPI000494A682|nr:type III pantothenate kinase [Thiomicrorhabdus sp. Milos-T2]
MNKLFIDIGNSLVKSATVIDSQYKTNDAITLVELLDSKLQKLEENGIPSEVYICSVADDAQVEILTSMIQNRWSIFPIRLSSQQNCCGLKSGYEVFTKLGADRWYAMQGGIAIYDCPLIIIDAGTALTIDSVIDGKHIGGFIVPGLYTMHSSLSVSTANLEIEGQDNVNVEFNDGQLLANNTQSAILGGTLYMVAAYVNRVIYDLSCQMETQFKVLITGGDAVQIGRILDVSYDYIPDLVLQGMVNTVEAVKKV